MLKSENLNDLVVISDFDGTISKYDTNDLLVERFGNKENERIERLFREGKIGLKEGMRLHFQELDIDEKIYLDFILNNVELDIGFKQFYIKLEEHSIPLVIVSGGFLNGILPFLEKEKIKIECIYANKLIFKEGKIEVECFSSEAECKGKFQPCGNCKLKHFEEIKKTYRRALFIGDGLTDRCIAESADIVFAKDDLAKYCSETRIPYISYENFNDISKKLFGEQLIKMIP